MHHNKNYSSPDEENIRFTNYLNNLRLADERNEIEGSLIHGETIFSDLSEVEFAETWLTSRAKLQPTVTLPKVVLNDKNKAFTENILKYHQDIKLFSPINPSQLVDWSTGSSIYVTSVKNQVVMIFLLLGLG